MSEYHLAEDLNFISENPAIERSATPSTRRHATSAFRLAARNHQSGLPMAAPVADDFPSFVSIRHSRHLAAKRVLDIVASGLGLVALLPLFLIVALMIKITSNGPVFFRQEREGLGGKSFVALKFRSMSVEKGDTTGVAQTVKHDPRVTSVGRVLRRTSIDELPQLINVLVGDMSLVGPRPHVFNMRAGGMLYKHLVPYYDVRLKMLPGLTGWAQANGLRGSTEKADVARARIDHDIAYVQNFSIWLDLKIILRTIRHEFIGGSAD